MPHPDSWLIDWLVGQKLLTREIIAEYQRKLDLALRDHPFSNPDRPTLGGLLEQGGHLTKAQREAGEKEAARRRGEFANWRSQTLRDQARRPPGPT